MLSGCACGLTISAPAENNLTSQANAPSDSQLREILREEMRKLENPKVILPATDSKPLFPPVALPTNGFAVAATNYPDWELRRILREEIRRGSKPTPAAPPSLFNPDVRTTQTRTNIVLPPPIVLDVVGETNRLVPLSPLQFNPDPGGVPTLRAAPAPLFGEAPTVILPPPSVAQTPKEPAVSRQLAPVILPEPVTPADPPPSISDPLPREDLKLKPVTPSDFHAREYPVPPPGKTNGTPVQNPDRWRAPFVPWRRYTSGEIAEVPYEKERPKLWHPYRQSVLKGDAPVIGQDIFLNLTLSSVSEFEARRLPTPSAVSSAQPGSSEFFGRGEQYALQNYAAFTVDLFKGETAFKPVQWLVHVQPVYNFNYIHARETGVVSPNPGGHIGAGGDPPFPRNGGIVDPDDVGGVIPGLKGASDDFEGRRHTTRLKDYFALQEAFAEIHLADLSDNYDFISSRFGNQPFISDFRGFIFNDINLGARVFGNADNNRYQYNIAAFDMNEKDTNSELNTFDRRNQRVLIANLYRQDFIWKGYTAQLSFHANFDDADTHYDENGNIVRPAPLGSVAEHNVRAYYFGWAGDGHIGRLNLSHAFYQAVGRDQFNGLAGQATDINAQMAALELSYDRDWARYKASFFYASGDGSAEDDQAQGFDTILDNPNFTGGPFSYYVRQGFNLAGSSVNLKQRGSLVPNLRTSKLQGQANFVNPGIYLWGLGGEFDLTPKLRNFINFNYLRFVETDTLQTALLTDEVDHELGFDLSIGFQYRPLLTDNIIISTGFGTLLPGRGFKDIYRTNPDPVPGFNPRKSGDVDDFLYSALLAVTFTF